MTEEPIEQPDEPLRCARCGREPREGENARDLWRSPLADDQVWCLICYRREFQRERLIPVTDDDVYVAIPRAFGLILVLHCARPGTTDVTEMLQRLLNQDAREMAATLTALALAAKALAMLTPNPTPENPDAPVGDRVIGALRLAERAVMRWTAPGDSHEAESRAPA